MGITIDGDLKSLDYKGVKYDLMDTVHVTYKHEQKIADMSLIDMNLDDRNYPTLICEVEGYGIISKIYNKDEFQLSMHPQGAFKILEERHVPEILKGKQVVPDEHSFKDIKLENILKMTKLKPEFRRKTMD